MSPLHTSALHPTSPGDLRWPLHPAWNSPFSVCPWPPVPCRGVWAGTAMGRAACAVTSLVGGGQGLALSRPVGSQPPWPTSDPGVAEQSPRVFHRLVNGAEHHVGIRRAHQPRLRGAPSPPPPPRSPPAPSPASTHHPSPPWAWPGDGGSPPLGLGPPSFAGLPTCELGRWVPRREGPPGLSAETGAGGERGCSQRSRAEGLHRRPAPRPGWARVTLGDPASGWGLRAPHGLGIGVQALEEPHCSRKGASQAPALTPLPGGRTPGGGLRGPGSRPGPCRPSRMSCPRSAPA